MDTRVNKLNGAGRRFKRILMTLVAIISVLWPYMFSIASTETTFTLTNRTRYFLHAKINNETFVYIEPDGSVIAEVTAPTSVYATVRYSPGQAVKGSGERTVDIQANSSSSGGSTTCSENDSGNDTCSSTEPTSSSSASPGRWDVSPSDLTAD